MHKYILVGLGIIMPFMLTGCGAVNSTLDCVDLWRYQNCILVDGNTDAGW